MQMVKRFHILFIIAENFAIITLIMKNKYVVGIDEAGRGPLAGPVSVSAVIMTLDDYTTIKRKIRSMKWLTSNGFAFLKDSKKLSEKQREQWFEQINQWKKEGMLQYANTMTGASLIDNEGISVVIKKAVTRLLKKLDNADPKNTHVMLDGSLHAPEIYTNQNTIVKGDELEPIISLASIISKVKRDNKMKGLESKYKRYEMDVHKGYGTEKHRKLIKKYGISKIHRRSFCKNIV
jgi:ribonuclease HII